MNTLTYTTAAPEPTTLYRVIDTKTGEPIGHTYTTRTRARKAADRLDLQYGRFATPFEWLRLIRPTDTFGQ